MNHLIVSVYLNKRKNRKSEPHSDRSSESSNKCCRGILPLLLHGQVLEWSPREFGEGQIWTEHSSFHGMINLESNLTAIREAFVGAFRVRIVTLLNAEKVLK